MLGNCEIPLCVRIAIVPQTSLILPNCEEAQVGAKYFIHFHVAADLAQRVFNFMNERCVLARAVDQFVAYSCLTFGAQLSNYLTSYKQWARKWNQRAYDCSFFRSISLSISNLCVFLIQWYYLPDQSNTASGNIKCKLNP